MAVKLSKVIGRYRTLLSFYRAGAAYERRDMALAETLAARSMRISAGDFVHPYILNYELLVFAGKPAEAEAQRHQIEKLIDANPSMNAETRNYIRFVVLSLTPDALLLGRFPGDIADPANTLGAVSKTYRLWWPYVRPRLAVQRLLTTTMSTSAISAQSSDWPIGGPHGADG